MILKGLDYGEFIYYNDEKKKIVQGNDYSGKWIRIKCTIIL